jgi:hypothetical protein
MYWRLATGLRGFLKEPLSLQQSRELIKQRLANREKNLLTLVKRAIYENQHSPYLKLLRIAGCEYGDLENMVHLHGIESTLIKLGKEGVYLNIEEFKGKKEVIRGGKVFKFRESDFDSPFLLHHLIANTGGSRGAATRTVWDLDYVAQGRAVYLICLLDAYDALNVPVVLWANPLPGWGQRVVLEHAKVRKPVAKWFTPVSERGFKPSLKNRIATRYITYTGRLWGANLPVPEYVPLDEAWRVAQWIADAVSQKRGCYVHADVSNAVRICQAAKEKNLDVAHVKFAIASEPITSVKRQEIESTGACVCPRYSSTEGGAIGWGCFHPSVPDDLHFCKDSLALIQQQRKVSHAGVSVDAFLFTSLLLSAPKILLNVELGDYGVIETRDCGCYFSELGFNDHIFNIRSFDKLTSQGMTFFGTDLIRLIEEILPAIFGGTPLDYQMVEEEDNAGNTCLSVIVSPSVGEIDENQLTKCILTELSKGKDVHRMMAEVWTQSKILRVKRIQPVVTTGGKLLPLHIQRSR